MAPPYRRWAGLLIGAALVGFGAVIWFGEARGLTV